jgi:rhodanese-related sulfurtransferase
MSNQVKTRESLLAEAKENIILVDASRAEVMIKNAALVLDVREPAEYQVGHLPQAVNVPRGVLEFKVGNHPDLNDPDRSILIYCKNGGRSALAAYTLKQMGFSQVEMLIGGFDGWDGVVHKIEVDPSIY